MSPDKRNLIWIDLEMTGLIPEVHRIIEIATVVTNSELQVLAEGPVIAIHQDEQSLQAMDAWNTKQHTESGLIKRVRQSKLGEIDAQALTLEFVRQWVPERVSPMCGNSICQDRRFLARWMPELERYFHYRHVDVSTVKELCARWSPEIAAGFTKEARHLALEDVRDSINELRFYRTNFFSGVDEDS